MKKNYSVSIYLDTRNKKTNGKFPVKLRVYTPNPRRQKLYATSFEFTEKEFHSIWLTSKPRNENRQIRKKLFALEARAEEVASNIVPFSFDKFENVLYRKKGAGTKLHYHYNEVLDSLNKDERLGTYDAYRTSEKSIISFIEARNERYENLSFQHVGVEWLKAYERYMTEELGRSLTTVGIYLRALRAVFNKAIDEGEIKKELYPFGKRKYQIPSGSKVKKALTQQELSVLFNAVPSNPEQEKAKDFWFFSFMCNGINIKDIALLKYGDIDNDKIHFYRAKTRFTSRSAMKQITVYLNDFSNGIIAKYGQAKSGKDQLVFDVIDPHALPEDQHRQIKNFVRFINQHIKKLAVANGLSPKISTYWARHSYSANAVRKGMSLEFVQEQLGHSSLKTTQSYFAGFEDQTKKEFAQSLMDFAEE